MEKGESAMAVVEAAMMEGRNAARVFLSQDPTDTMAMEQKLLNARAIQSRYVNDNNHDAAHGLLTLLSFTHCVPLALNWRNKSKQHTRRTTINQKRPDKYPLLIIQSKI